ncbi:MAG: hypothetical protein GXP16_09295 [Gammaproteobacteria bacterium]|nr:hypothetical protein [Gammaproteobacteria bacterium]
MKQTLFLLTLCAISASAQEQLQNEPSLNTPSQEQIKSSGIPEQRKRSINAFYSSAIDSSK